MNLIYVMYYSYEMKIFKLLLYMGNIYIKKKYKVYY